MLPGRLSGLSEDPMHWIEERICKPSNEKEVYVVCVGPEHNGSWDIERAKARYANGQWFVPKRGEVSEGGAVVGILAGFDR
jgi:hypothetical protein